MEKLLNLLNQYDDEEGKDLYEWEIEGEDIIGYNRFWGGYETIDVSKSVIISKRYGFIKWLVENDKISVHKLAKAELESGWSIENQFLDEDDRQTYYTYNTLMLLSIQDEPIEFLCSLLK